MKEYHKIQTVYKRNPEHNFKTLLIGEYALPEFEYLADNQWIFTEKVDGTNIRVMFDGEKIIFGGKTERADIPATLINRLAEMFHPKLNESKRIFDGEACLYGEGYGAKIQKGGGNYSQTQEFVLFDVRVGDWWLKRTDVEDVGSKLNISVVPIVGVDNLQKMVDMAREGFESSWGDFPAEGIVARPFIELQTRAGERIITKIKTKDFRS